MPRIGKSTLQTVLGKRGERAFIAHRDDPTTKPKQPRGRKCKAAPNGKPLSRIESVGACFEGCQKTGHGFVALCPCHSDSTPSLSINTGDDGKTLMHCQAGCSTEDILEQVGLTFADLAPAESDTTPGREPQHTKQRTLRSMYEYQDEQGGLLYQVVRYAPKDFRQRRLGDGNWEWSLNGVRRVLYRFPELLSAKKSRLVFVVEGEKDADNLAALGSLPQRTQVGQASGNKSTTKPCAAARWSFSPITMMLAASTRKMLLITSTVLPLRSRCWPSPAYLKKETCRIGSRLGVWPSS